MSKKQSRALSYTPTEQLPKLGKIKTDWDLKKHYYTSERDPRIEKDVAKAERAYAAFAKKYAQKNFTSSPKKLAGALQEYERLLAMPEVRKPLYYYSFRTTLNAADTIAQKRISLIEDRLTKASNQIIFFILKISALSKKEQKRYLANSDLARYHYLLSRIFLEAKHMLTEAEERILSLKSDVASGLWVQGTDKIFNKRTISYSGIEIPLPGAIERMDTLPSHQKPKLWKIITGELQDLAEIAENEINAIVTNKKINDELRGFDTPYEATIQGYENDQKSVLALVDAIEQKGFALSRRYYRLKAKQAGQRQIPYCNRNDVYGNEPLVPFDTAVSITRDTFYELDQRYGKIFDDMLTRGQIDAYPRQGKGGGAFCAGSINMPTFVLLNQVDTFRSLSTLAHEMGHAVHTELSKEQSPIYQDYSTTTAETASTFFEGLVQDKIIAILPEKQKATVLSRKIDEAIATICRQVAFFRYEQELHATIRKEGALTWQEMASMLKRHLVAYMGNGVSVTDADGLSFIYVGHFRRFFYVYTYAYGELMSGELRRRYQEDDGYATQIKSFLSAGGSDTVENIFASVDINTKTTETFLHSLGALEADIKMFEKLTQK